jgi:ribosomal protein S18 acetylase RimI-like enzyme
MPINIMLRQNFWNGIDISECLEYTDFTIVVLYGKLVVGFAFMVPNESQNQAYLSFIYVHPDWRCPKAPNTNNQDVSIAQYMMLYLIQTCPNDYDVNLHVSVNSSVVVFYQKFGFKIEEYIKNFYDKYYSNETRLSKDAFLMRLSRR